MENIGFCFVISHLQWLSQELHTTLRADCPLRTCHFLQLFLIPEDCTNSSEMELRLPVSRVGLSAQSSVALVLLGQKSTLLELISPFNSHFSHFIYQLLCQGSRIFV